MHCSKGLYNSYFRNIIHILVLYIWFCIFGWSRVEPGAGLEDPCGSLPMKDILWFCDSMTLWTQIHICMCVFAYICICKSWYSQTPQGNSQPDITRRWDKVKNLKQWHYQENLAQVFHKRPIDNGVVPSNRALLHQCQKRVIRCGKSEQGNAVKVSCLSTGD